MADAKTETDKIATADRVCVACNLPNGFFMNAWITTTGKVPLLGGGFAEEKRVAADPSKERVKIHGIAFPLGEPPEHRIAHGYAFTPNVPGDIAREWMKANEHSAMVVNECVFLATSTNEAVQKAAGLKGNRSGLEPLDTGTKFVEGRAIQKDP